MAVPNTSYTEIISTTIDNYRSTLSDNVTKHISLLKWLQKKGNTEPASGGTSLLENLMYQENGTFSAH